jgi:hypothetical protein
MLKSSPRSSIPDAFGIGTFSRKLTCRKTCDRYRRSSIPDTFRHRHFKVCFKPNDLMKTPTTINTQIKPPVFNAMCLFHTGEPYGLVLPRVILGSLGPSHTSESVFPRQHCTMRSIGVGYFVRDIDENIHSTSPIPDPPTEKATRWDILVLDTIRFGAFKGLINSKSCISFYFVCESKQVI